MFDTIIRNASLADGRTGIQIAIAGGKIAEVAELIDARANEEIDAGGCLVSPPFVDAHFHLDSTLSYGQPRINQSGTLLEGISLWGELKPHLTHEAVVERALRYCRWAIGKGLLAIRSHVDICDDRLLAVDALLDVRERMKPFVDIQLVAFPQDGYLRSANAKANLKRALDKGVDVVGGIPQFERTIEAGAQSVRELCETAEKRGLMVDMHCDESDDPLSRHVETLACETTRLGLNGRVTGSHLTSMHSMDNYYVSKLIPLMVEADLRVVANPLINITLQGRHDSYPKRRGLTRVPELIDAGLTVAFAQDCNLDPWYPLGSADLLDAAHMGLHVGMMTGHEAMKKCFMAVTSNPARILELDGYGIAPGCNADLVMLQAGNQIEAIRTRAARLMVMRRGKVIARTPASSATLDLGGQSYEIDYRH